MRPPMQLQLDEAGQSSGLTHYSHVVDLTMPMPGEATSTNILDHYAGFDSPSGASSTGRPPRASHMRTDSTFSVQSNASDSLSPNARGFPFHASLAEANRTGKSPLHSPSLNSSTSSLRQSVAMLKDGIFPPGMSMRRPRRDSSESDGSHYDDEEDHGYDMEKGGPFDSYPGSQDHQTESQDQSDIFSNAPDSPSVPKRQSSAPATRPARSPASIPVALPALGDKERGKGEMAADKTPLQRLIGLGVNDVENSMTPRLADKRSISPDRATRGENKGSIAGATDATATKEDDLEMERQQSYSSETEDPNRPRTLKEARALAKERAKLRAQSKGANSPPKAATSPGEKPEKERRPSTTYSQDDVSEHAMRADEVRRKSTITAADGAGWRGHSRQLATPHSSGTGDDDMQAAAAPRRPSNASRGVTSTTGMDALQSAVGEAISDVSFSSTTSTVAAAPPLSSRARATDEPPPARAVSEIRGAVEADNDSSAPSATSFDSARESQTLSRPDSAVVAPRLDSTWTREPERPGHEGTPVARGPTAEPSGFPSSPSIPMIASTTGPFALPEKEKDAQKFVPHHMMPQQRSTAPNKIARLDIYGKTVPWPAAFNPAAIIEQRRLAPWERARSYAHYCNDLSKIPSGLSIWLDMVQRPAQRQVVEPAVPARGHQRGEGTDQSGYATSVRSDATFPVRGDGGRAKELQQGLPATIEESLPGTLPSNLPYPSLAQVPTKSSSSSMEDAAANERDRSGGLGRSGNFFTSLGRARSVRRTPNTGSFTSLSPLTGGNGSTSTPVRGQMRGKGKTISNPISMSSSPSVNLIGASGRELSPPNEPQSSPSPQGTIGRGQMPSSPSFSSHTNKTPMGPRAQSGNAIPFSNTPASRRESTTSVKSQDKSLPTSPREATGEFKQNIVKSSFTYGSVRDNKSPRSNFAVLQPPTVLGHRNSSDASIKSGSNSRRGSHQQAKPTPAENEALDKLADVLPDAERATLLDYLRKAGGNDLVAIGDYLQAQSKSEGRHLFR